MGIDDVSDGLSKRFNAGEVASLAHYLGSALASTNTNAVNYSDIAARTDNTPAAGFGFGWRVTVQTAASTNVIGGAWRLQVTDVTGASEDFKWVGSVMVAGAAASDVFEFDSQGIRAALAKAVPAGGEAGTGLRLSSTSNFGVFFGSGAPTLSAAQGSLYLRTDGSSTSTRLYVNTNGSTGWTNVTTAT